ncbi:MAG: lipoate--protein ligase family protein [Deltaproteobacteria bacterium]|nr:lipoate--protein ligase family protein [Deltaproteobacteria bacterium]MBI3077305.1 lipoate--protein ligase family protein [Deltaproteobacteria bacterium]
MEVWRLLDTGLADGYRNMAVDEAVLVACSGGVVPPTVRFYRWQPPGLSLGYFQRTDQGLDLGACQRLGVDVVRRPTGGRAVLHDDEVTYSVVAPFGARFPEGEVRENFAIVTGCLVKGLEALGLQASLLAPQRIKGSEFAPGRQSACFLTYAGYEVMVAGRKLVGSAQRAFERAFLQHGAILLGFDAEKHRAILRGQAPREEGIRYFTDRITCLREQLSYPVGPGELINAMCEGFEKALGVRLEPGALTAQEESLARDLRGKYASRAWTFRR